MSILFLAIYSVKVENSRQMCRQYSTLEQCEMEIDMGEFLSELDLDI